MVNWILGDLFLKDFGHQGSIKTLWETRWKFPFEDFEPIFNKLVEGKTCTADPDARSTALIPGVFLLGNVNDPYDDAFASAFFPTAEALAKEAQSLESSDRARAIELYRRSACVYRLSRFPYIGTPLKRKAYEEQKKVYMRGARLWDVPLTEEIIPFTDAVEGDGKEIPLY
ncbi:hypothetical protein LTR16_008422, partial [Cryomyces antarcticus]